MRKYFLFTAVLILLSVNAFAQKTDNPGYFDSPGFIAAGAGMLYPYGGTHRDPELRPFVTGMWNVIRSEYGFLGLSVTGIFTTPYRNFDNGQVRYKISTQQYIGDISLNYVTGSKSFNFWVGFGFNLNYAVSQMRNIENDATDVRSDYEKNFYQTVYGYQYQIGLEYLLTRDGSWGLYVLVRGQYTNRAHFDIDKTVEFPDGSTEYVNEHNTMDLSNRSYTFGLTYHF